MQENLIYHHLDFELIHSPDKWRTDTLTYFQEQGFSLKDSGPGHLVFERGSKMKNMITRNPLKWKSNTKIYLTDNNVKAKFEINTIHQFVTLNEEQLWNTFVANYQQTIETGDSLITENKKAVRATKSASWKYLGYALLGAIIFGIPSAIIGYYLNVEAIARGGAIGGALFFLRYKINKEKEASKIQ